MDKLPVDSATAERLVVGTEEFLVLATSDQTNGDLCAGLLTMPPGGGPPVMHRHAPSEVYYVLQGELTFYLGEGAEVRRVRAGAQSAVPMAGGTPHTVRNESAADAVALVVHSPGRVIEAFSRGAAALAAEGPPDMSAVLELAARSGVELLGPVPELVD